MYLQRKVQEHLMEKPNATWTDFSSRIIQQDVSYQVSSNFLNEEEHTKVQVASLRQEKKSSFRAARTPGQRIREHPPN